MLDRKQYQRLTVELEKSTVEKLNAAAKEFKVTRVKIIRACIEAELPRLIDRERKRMKRQTQA